MQTRKLLDFFNFGSIIKSISSTKKDIKKSKSNQDLIKKCMELETINIALSISYGWIKVFKPVYNCVIYLQYENKMVTDRIVAVSAILLSH